MIFRSQHRKKAEIFIQNLQEKHAMTDRGILTSFLGMRVTRDLALRKLWLTQDASIEKIANSFYFANDSVTCDFPFLLPNAEIPLKNKKHAATKEIHHFQSLFGSANYATISNCLDISKYSNLLAEHMQNPYIQQSTLAGRIISNLYSTRHLSILCSDDNSSPELTVASHAGFTDNLQARY